MIYCIKSQKGIRILKRVDFLYTLDLVISSEQFKLRIKGANCCLGFRSNWEITNGNNE